MGRHHGVQVVRDSVRNSMKEAATGHGNGIDCPRDLDRNAARF